MISEIGLLWVTLCVQYVAVIQSVDDVLFPTAIQRKGGLHSTPGSQGLL